MKIMLIVVLSVIVLVYAQPFLVPLTFSALFAMLLLPLVKQLNRKGFGKGASALVAVLMLVIIAGLIIFLIAWQVQDIASDASKIEKELTNKWHELQAFISEKLGISAQEQQQMIKKQQSGSGGKLSAIVTGMLSGLGSLIANTVLVLVYTFLLIYFRGKLKIFVLRLTSKENQKNTTSILEKIQKVSQKYLGGLAIMIMVLWVMYGIGFSIIGVKHALFFAILCGLLEIVPFVGNLAGTTLTVLMSLAQGGDPQLIIWILVVYALVQFIQTYLLEPLIVGAGVSINPLFTIVGLIAGELLWGIPGMIVAIPLLGIAKIIFDHVEALKPYGYLIGTEKKNNRNASKGLKTIIQKFKLLFVRHKDY